MRGRCRAESTDRAYRLIDFLGYARNSPTVGTLYATLGTLGSAWDGFGFARLDSRQFFAGLPREPEEAAMVQVKAITKLAESSDRACGGKIRRKTPG
ncbi:MULTISPECIES: hypothetical protein [unclassified Streptomyces]|uniref:hypothetical protein n=1 Tax=unclassified Streptomyces TaxID=2593676 RepID=UPI00036F176D|nr:hypothetical protein [Streptomyces sp. 303MFCol5.2]